MQVVLELPFPPSLNKYWMHLRKHVVSPEGRKYKCNVQAAVAHWHGDTTLLGRLRVEILLQKDTHGRFDVDNFAKVLLDGLKPAYVFRGLYKDDSQIDELHIYRGKKHIKPRAVVRVTELEGWEEVLPTVEEFLRGERVLKQ